MKKLIFLGLIVGLSAGAAAHDNSRGKATCSFGESAVVIEYGRPEFKGRDIGQVPDGTIWRIGADAATTLNSAAALQFGDQKVPAGTYRLLAQKMGPRKWELIVSADPEAGPRGRDESQDVARVPLKFAELAEPVGMLTIELPETDSGAQLRILWGSAGLSAPFSAD